MGSARRASRSFVSASQSAARAGAAAAGGATRTVHRMTGASGASTTGLSHLIELTAAGSVGDAFVAVALAGTLFFNTSLDQARSQVALYLLVTMAPFAVLAPFIGPLLDRVQQGRRFILAGTLLARGLLCWGMSAALHQDPVTLFPAAFGVLILQKVYTVTRASVTPRLLPEQLTLVSANARTTLASLVASTLGVLLAAGLAWTSSAAWVLRVGALVYIAGTVIGVRLPGSVDAAEAGAAARAGAAADPQWENGAPGGPAYPGPVPRQPGPDGYARPDGYPGPDGYPRPDGYPGPNGRPETAPGGARNGTTRPLRQRSQGGLRALRMVGPVVGEAMRGNAALRAFSGFMLLFLAFLLRADHFRGMPQNAALGALAAAVAAGGFLGTAVGSRLRARRPHLIIFGMLAIAIAVTAVSAWFFGLWTALAVAFVAATSQALVKLALDSTVQREIKEDIRSSTFAVSETLNQLSWVLGGMAGLALSLTSSGVAGLSVAAAGLAVALGLLVAGRRSRQLRARRRVAAQVS
ncbi:MAG: MFS transporter [Streptosporangiaceae bacterium]